MLWGLIKPKPKPEAKPRETRAEVLARAFGPPVTQEEQLKSLPELEQELKDAMVCPAGRGYVYIRTVLTKAGKTPPRVALKCKLREELHTDPHVFYTEIKQLCCGEHGKCPAWQKLGPGFKG